MSDTDPTASIHAATPALNSIAKVVSPTRQSVAGDWFNAFRFITAAAALFAFIAFGTVFGETSLYSGSSFNAAAGIAGAVMTVLGFLPVIALFSVLRAKEA